MHIFVINLPEDVARREAIEQQLQALGLSYEILPAVRGKNLCQEEQNESYDETWHKRNEGRPATPGELGCALSHIAVYRLICERGLPHALVLEDDAWLNPNLTELLSAIEAKEDPERKDVILLTWYRAIHLKHFETIWSGYNLATVKLAFCTHGYVISHAAAGALLEALYPVRHMVDCWNWLQRHRIVRIRAVFPTCITANLAFESGLDDAKRQASINLPLLPRLRRRLWRAFWIVFDRVLGIAHKLTRRV